MTERVSSGGVQIAWEQGGSGDPLLLIMGHRWSRRMWHPVLERLQQRFRVITFDNRGVGESDVPTTDYPLAAMTSDAIAVLDAAGVARAHVLGVSMGGVIAQDLALHHADRADRLVLGCATAMTGKRLRLTPARQINYLLPDKVVNAAGRSLLYGTWATTPAIRSDLQVLAGERTTRRGLLGQARAVSAHRVDLEDIRRITHPTLVLHGGKDKVVPVAWGRELAALIPGAQCTVFESAGHNFMATHGEETASRTIDFLENTA